VSKIKVLITTSGIGARLGELTNHTNKALITVGGKPVLSYILDAYPKDTSFVITLGYKGDLVRQFVKLVYPNLKVEFVEIDNYDGPGSSLLYSMYKAKGHLDCPFIFHASDTIITDAPIPMIDSYNWNGVYDLGTEHSAQYRLVQVLNDNEMGVIYDKEAGTGKANHAHIGLCGISDWYDFWDIAGSLLAREDTSLSDVHVINIMRQQGKRFALYHYPSWKDVGNIDALETANKALTTEETVTLPKTDQIAYIFDDKIVKFFSDEDTVSKRLKRADYLGEAVPKITGYTHNFYTYEKAVGPLLRGIYPSEIHAFLLWCQENLWGREEAPPEYTKLCRAFYQEKTMKRLERFYAETGIVDSEELLNGEKVPKLEYLLTSRVPWLSINQGIPTKKMHGDLHFSNVIKTKNGYKLLDWREDFGGSTEIGDVYYDLAKLNHGMLVSHDLVNENRFMIKRGNFDVEVDIQRHHRLVECQDVFYSFLSKFGYDPQKVDILTALIYLNICPLHHYPYNIFLYYFGKKMLCDILKKVRYW